MGKYDSKNQYNKIHYKQFNIRLNIDDDAEIIAYLDGLESLPDFLRRAVNNAKMAQKKVPSRARKRRSCRMARLLIYGWFFFLLSIPWFIGCWG